MSIETTRRKTVTLTFGECAENAAGMEKIGKKAERGFTCDELRQIERKFPGKCEMADLRGLMTESNIALPEALILVIRNPYPDLVDELEQIMFCDEERVDENGQISGVLWDKEKFQYQKKVNSIARYNLCFSHLESDYKRDSDIEKGKGTIYNINAIPVLDELHRRIGLLTESDLKCEGNFYYDSDKCYISFHGDGERMKVVGFRLGDEYPLHFRWHVGQIPVSDYATVFLNRGDMYIMSEFTTGCKKMPKTKLMLKHAAGFNPIIFKVKK